MKTLFSTIIIGLLFSTTVFAQNSFTMSSLTKLSDWALYTASISSFDMNKDSKKDIVAIYHDSEVNWLYINYQGEGEQNLKLDFPFYIDNFEIADLNSDGWQDIVVVGGRGDSIYIFLHNGFCHQSAPDIAMYSGRIVDAVAKGDFNKDGRDDLVCTNYNESFLTMFIQTSSPSHFESYQIPAAQGGENQVKVWDINGDGWDDIVFLTGGGFFGLTATSGIYVYLNDNGSFTSPPTLFKIPDPSGSSLPLLTTSVVYGNFFGTGDGLLINSLFGGPNDTRFIQYQNGNWVDMRLTNMGAYYPSTISADFNNDGKDEVVYLFDSNLNVFEFSTLDSKTFQNFNTYSGHLYKVSNQLLTQGDFNNDGTLDFALISPWGGITVFYNNYVTTGISDSYGNTEVNFSIYPNPTVNSVNVSFGDDIGEYSSIITDISGRVVLSQRHSQKNISFDLKGFTPGVYFLNITGKGKNAVSSRFVVQ